MIPTYAVSDEGNGKTSVVTFFYSYEEAKEYAKKLSEIDSGKAYYVHDNIGYFWKGRFNEITKGSRDISQREQDLNSCGGN